MRLNMANSPLALLIASAALWSSTLAEPSDFHPPPRVLKGAPSSAAAADVLVYDDAQLRRRGKGSSSVGSSEEEAEDDDDDGSDTTGGSSTGSSSTKSSSSSGKDKTAQCAMYSIAYKSVSDLGGYSSLFDGIDQGGFVGENAPPAVRVDDSCRLCWPVCGRLGVKLCPATCEDHEDQVEFCMDASDKSGCDTCEESCMLQCLEFVSRCCCCGEERKMVDFRAENHIGNQAQAIGDEQQILAIQQPVARLLQAVLTPGQLLFEDDATTESISSYAGAQVSGSLATATFPGVSMGVIGEGLGLIFGEPGADVPASSAGSATVLFRSGGFLNGLGKCGTNVTEIDFKVIKTSTADVTNCVFRLVIKDSMGWHISTSTYSPNGDHMVDVMEDTDWNPYDPYTNSGSASAGTIGTGMSDPSFNCVEFVGGWFSASVGTADIGGAVYEGCVLEQFTVMGKGPSITC